MSLTMALSDWLATLPLFGRETPGIEPFSQSSGTALYRLDWKGNRAVLKHYTITPDLTSRTSPDKRRAEAEALRIFAPLQRAPELMWEGEMPPRFGGDALIYRWIEGTRASDRVITDVQNRSFATALRAVHSSSPQPKLLSPTPRTLEAWWSWVHERYRDMQMHLADNLPVEVSDTLSRLLQPVAGDVQAHKRFWQGAPLTTVHGRPEPANLIFSQGHAMLKNWQDFGLGDPAHEVASASRMLAQLWGEEAAQHLIDCYLADEQDNMLTRRIEIYRRVWPFGALLSSISNQVKPSDGPPHKADESATIAFHFRHLLVTYEWPQRTVDTVVPALDEWLGGDIFKSKVAKGMVKG